MPQLTYKILASIHLAELEADVNLHRDAPGQWVPLGGITAAMDADGDILFMQAVTAIVAISEEEYEAWHTGTFGCAG